MYPAHFGNNPLFPNKKDFKVVLKNHVSGMGVMTFKSFSKGALICALAGDIITDIRQHSLQIEPDLHLYDTYFSGYFLHSCSPNVYLDMKNLLVYATQEINSMDYLLMDYAQTEDYLYKEFPCTCGAYNCRGWVTGRKQLPGNRQIDQDIMDIAMHPFERRQSI
nr:SET domain-containing protein-lysine N-methyltransferase [Desulfobulbaceae bacterium]